jgi:hypothetical protein
MWVTSELLQLRILHLTKKNQSIQRHYRPQKREDDQSIRGHYPQKREDDQSIWKGSDFCSLAKCVVVDLNLLEPRITGPILLTNIRRRRDGQATTPPVRMRRRRPRLPAIFSDVIFRETWAPCTQHAHDDARTMARFIWLTKPRSSQAQA